MKSGDTAIVFPGQGSQRTGMARDFCESFASARVTFEEASQALGLDLGAICFLPDDRLHLTEYAQPAILVTEIAMLRALRAEFGLGASWFGGHSLGEYSAFVAAGVLPLTEAVKLVRQRGRLMQMAVPVGQGRMVAVIGAGLEAAVIEKTLAGLDVCVANENASSQVVLSGGASDTDKAQARITKITGQRLRFIELDVSAPFHSSLMVDVEQPLAIALRAASEGFTAANAGCVTSNFTGTFHIPETDAIIDALVRQVSNTVKWRTNMETLVGRASRIVEVGPGRPLRGFFRTIGINVESITDVRSARRAAEPQAFA